MASRAAPHAARSPIWGSDSRYARTWTTTALVAASAWIAIAVLQSPRLPLLGITVGLGAMGGILFVRAPASTVRGRRQYVSGVLASAGAVLVTVGVGHHLLAGMMVAALLACSSPSVLRWLSGG
jgi:hypothetical protein